ncbi:MAG: hypothetical protein IT317_02640 [Anaerolineales bacterium]|nr:hypothetical protein [Anaerolineales bacterium]
MAAKPSTRPRSRPWPQAVLPVLVAGRLAGPRVGPAVVVTVLLPPHRAAQRL